MQRIVNLSSLHTLHPVSTGISAFSKLCDKYSRGSCYSCCPGIFTQLSNKAWVMYIYLNNLNTLINPYKLGKISTQEFLDGMLKIFNFLDNNLIPFSLIDRNRIEGNLANFVSIRGAHELTAEQMAKALIEEAWNAIIEFKDEDFIKFDHLIEESKDTPTYLVSNTNELNAHKILCILKERFPNIAWKDVDLAVNANSDDGILEIAPNIFLCLSYKVHAFKTTQENIALQATTPSLIRYLINKFNVNKNDIEIISQFGKDLEEAEGIGVPQQNLKTANAFYPEPNKEFRFAQ